MVEIANKNINVNIDKIMAWEIIIMDKLMDKGMAMCRIIGDRYG